jgi:hypothetical protein
MTELPNPFLSSAASDAAADTSAVASPSSSPLDEATADNRFVLDELAFFEAIEPVPLFLRPVIELLAGYA